MSHSHNNILIALAGQPNCGKSTIFNMLTGSHQHVANFPGVTVEKKQGVYRDGDRKIEIVDLPGTYSLTSYTQEERVTRDFLLLEKPEVVVAVMDASNMERHLYLVFQLLEMRVPVIICLNMIDVADRRGIKIDIAALSEALAVPVIVTNGKSGRGREELKQAVREQTLRHDHSPPPRYIDYGSVLEPIMIGLKEKLEKRPHLMEDFPPRWLSVKLLENDSEVRRIIQHHTHDNSEDEILAYLDEQRQVLKQQRISPEKVIASSRYKFAAAIVEKCSTRPQTPGRTLTDRIDAVALHQLWAPLTLGLVLFLFYQIAMGLGLWASEAAFPFFNQLKITTQNLLATSDPLRSGLLESLMVDGLVGGIVSILYYIPMFFILFALLAIMEDSGYMTRVAFILDRLLRWFGLHGQSTLPMILGGVVVGGCCVPGVLATRAMKDEKARLVTILIMPLMNCLAKLPFYALIVGIMFPPESGLTLGGRIIFGTQGLVLFALSVFSFITALLMAKLFSHTLVKGEAAPFVMELPVYHLPTPGGVLRRAVERVWIFVKKIITVVAMVQIIVWFFVTFPGIGLERENHYDLEKQRLQQIMVTASGSGNPYSVLISNQENLSLLMDKQQQLRRIRTETMGDAARLTAEMEKLSRQNPEFFLIVNNGMSSDGVADSQARITAQAFRNYTRNLQTLRVTRRKEQIDNSFAGLAGKSLEPLSTLAGFEWRMNIAILASFAAKESLVGTLGTIYSVEEDSAEALGASVARTETGWTIWHKLAILVFVALFPPCLATILVIKNETASWAWAGFATVYPIILGFILAVIIFQAGPLLIGR